MTYSTLLCDIIVNKFIFIIITIIYLLVSFAIYNIVCFTNILNFYLKKKVLQLHYYIQKSVSESL